MRASATASLDRLCHQVVQQSKPKRKKKRKRDSKAKASHHHDDGADVDEADDPDEASDEEDIESQDWPAASSASVAPRPPSAATQTPTTLSTASSSRPTNPQRDYDDEILRKKAADHLVALADTLRSQPSRGPPQQSPQPPKESAGDFLMQMADALARSPLSSDPTASDFFRGLAEAAKRSEQAQPQSQPSHVEPAQSSSSNVKATTSSFDATVPKFREALARSVNAHRGNASSFAPEDQQSAAEKHAVAVMTAARLKSEKAAAARAQEKAAKSPLTTPAAVQQPEQQKRVSMITCHHDDGTSFEVPAAVAPDGEKIGLDTIEVAIAMADKQRQERRRARGGDCDDDDDIVPVITIVGGNAKDIEAFAKGQKGLESRLDIRNYEVVGPQEVKVLRNDDGSSPTTGIDDASHFYEAVRNRSSTHSSGSTVEMKKRRQPRTRHESTPENPRHLMVRVERRPKAAKTAAGKGAPQASSSHDTAELVPKDVRAGAQEDIAAVDEVAHDGSYAKAQENMNPGSHVRNQCRGVSLARMGVPRGGIIPPTELSAQLTVLMVQDIVDGTSRQQGNGPVDFGELSGGLRAQLGKWDSFVDWDALASFSKRKDLQDWKQSEGINGTRKEGEEEGGTLGLGDDLFAAIAKPSSYNHWHWTLSGRPSDWRSEAAKAGQPAS